jgi:hypothetical protein
MVGFRVVSAAVLPLRGDVRPLREARPLRALPPAAGPHAERVALSSGGLDASLEGGLPASADVRWYRAAGLSAARAWAAGPSAPAPGVPARAVHAHVQAYQRTLRDRPV